MNKITQEFKKETLYKRQTDNVNLSFDKISSKSSRIYYVSLILFSMLSIILAFVYLNNFQTIEKFDFVIENITWQMIILLILMFIFIMFLLSLIDFLKIYSQSKNKRFGVVYKSVVLKECFGRLTWCGMGKFAMQNKYLVDKKINNSVVTNVTHADFFKKFTFVLYATVLIILAPIFWLNDVNIWIYVLACLYYLYHLLYVLLCICYCYKNVATMQFVGKIVKCFYKFNLIKDYEKTLLVITDKLFLNSKSIRQNKSLSLVEISSNLLVEFLRAMSIYYIIISLNFDGGNLIWTVLFNCFLFNVILDIWPLKNGILIFEILFVILFSNIFFEGYVFYGIVIYRIFDYYAFVLQYLIILLIEKCESGLRRKKVSN